MTTEELTINDKFPPTTTVKEDKKADGRTKTKDAKEKMPIDTFMGIDVNDFRKNEGIDDKIQVEMTASLKAKFRRWYDRHLILLRGRVHELLDFRDWKAFGVTPIPNPANPRQFTPSEDFDAELYHKDPLKYEAAIEEKLGEIIDPKYGGDNPTKYRTRLQYQELLKESKVKYGSIQIEARKLNITLDMKDLK